MKESLFNKLATLSQRHEELAALMSDPEIINNQNRFRDLGKEYAQLGEIVQCFAKYQKNEAGIHSAQAMLSEDDAEMKELATLELHSLQEQREKLVEQLQLLLLPKDPHDSSNVFLEIRAAAGGDEAAIFAGDLFRMYARYAERQGWKLEIISEHGGEHGGFKEVISRIVGQGAYSKLKFESGAHRVQRIPTTEAQGRIHTSTCTVAVMPEVDEIESIAINPADLKIDTYRASGAGGQHVNKTESAIRITHLPTGIVVECQDERSQHKNRARAMSLLQSKILSGQQEAQQQETAETRRSLVGTGDRSERIRTYNFPQGRVTDHRISLTLYKLDAVIEGDLGDIIEPLLREQQAELLASIAH